MVIGNKLNIDERKKLQTLFSLFFYFSWDTPMKERKAWGNETFATFFPNLSYFYCPPKFFLFFSHLRRCFFVRQCFQCSNLLKYVSTVFQNSFFRKDDEWIWKTENQGQHEKRANDAWQQNWLDTDLRLELFKTTAWTAFKLVLISIFTS